MKLVNLTPHPIVICDGSGEPLLTVQPSGVVARCAQVRQVIGAVTVESHTIPITRVLMKDLEGLPKREPDTLYVVSVIAAQAAQAIGRHDVLITDDAVRDADGRVVGCRALSRLADVDDTNRRQGGDNGRTLNTTGPRIKSDTRGFAIRESRGVLLRWL